MDASRLWQLNCPDSFVYEANQSRAIVFGVDFTRPPAATNGASHCGSTLQQAEKDATFIASAVQERMIGRKDESDEVQIYTYTPSPATMTSALLLEWRRCSMNSSG